MHSKENIFHTKNRNKFEHSYLWNDREIFLDSGYFKGLLYEKDNYHEESLRIKDFIDNSNLIPVINPVVVSEVLNFSVKAGIPAIDIDQYLHESNVVYPVTEQDHKNALSLNYEFGNKINFNDCMIILTMDNFDINRIVTFDRVFFKFQNFHIINDF